MTTKLFLTMSVLAAVIPCSQINAVAKKAVKTNKAAKASSAATISYFDSLQGQAKHYADASVKAVNKAKASFVKTLPVVPAVVTKTNVAKAFAATALTSLAGYVGYKTYNAEPVVAVVTEQPVTEVKPETPAKPTVSEAPKAPEANKVDAKTTYMQKAEAGFNKVKAYVQTNPCTTVCAATAAVALAYGVYSYVYGENAAN